MLDILFVHPNASSLIYQGLANKNAAIEPPIWAALLANSIRQTGKKTAIIDTEAEGLNYKESVKRILEIKSKIICFVVYGQQPSASTQNMEGATATAKLLKDYDPSTFIVFVGGHLAALPKETLIKENYINAVCLNEGVYALRNLVKLEKFEDKYLEKVEGIAFRTEENTITLNKPSPIVPKRDLVEHLPGMAWDLLPSLNKYRTAGWHSWSNNSEKQPFAAIYTSLGCPYRCTFCMINIINRTDSSEDISSADSNAFRWWPPEFIIKQFDYLAEQGVKNIKIADELFVLNPRHFQAICDLIIERGYNFNIWAYSRVDSCKPQYLEKLSSAGVKWLGLGIENPNSKRRAEIHKDHFEDVGVVDLIKMIRSAGINVGGNYIFGLPFDTLESMEETLRFALDNPTEMANFYSAMAYPGSPLHIEARKNNLPLPKEYVGYSQHAYETHNLQNKNLSSAEILKFRDYAWDKYHSNEKYLNLMKNRFGNKALTELSETKKVKLKRRLLQT